MPDRIVKKACSPEGHVMIMYEANAHAKAHGIKEKLYAVMFNQLPCVNPSSQEFAEMMWKRHVDLYHMTEEPVKKGARLPKRAESGSAVLAKGCNVK